MRNIIKTEAPKNWKEFCQKHNDMIYRDLDDKNLPEEERKKRQNLKYDMKEHLLLFEQSGLCCYCCRRITPDKGHIEHFKPRDKYPHLSMEPTNLLVSCNANTCGMHKENTEVPESLHYSNWQERFYYTTDGKIHAKDGDTDGDTLINKILNLNDRSLVESRRRLYFECVAMAVDDELREYIKAYYIDPDENGNLPQFAPMVEYFYRSGEFG